MIYALFKNFDIWIGDPTDTNIEEKSAENYHRLSAIDLRKLEAKLEMATAGELESNRKTSFNSKG